MLLGLSPISAEQQISLIESTTGKAKSDEKRYSFSLRLVNENDKGVSFVCITDNSPQPRTDSIVAGAGTCRDERVSAEILGQPSGIRCSFRPIGPLLYTLQRISSCDFCQPYCQMSIVTNDDSKARSQAYAGRLMEVATADPGFELNQAATVRMVIGLSDWGLPLSGAFHIESGRIDLITLRGRWMIAQKAARAVSKINESHHPALRGACSPRCLASVIQRPPPRCSPPTTASTCAAVRTDHFACRQPLHDLR